MTMRIKGKRRIYMDLGDKKDRGKDINILEHNKGLIEQKGQL